MSDKTDKHALLKQQMKVSRGQVPDHLSGEVLLSDDYSQITRHAFRFQSPGGVRFWYQLGKGLTVQMDDPALEDEFRIYLMGTVFGAVAWLNGLLPIHASAVIKGESAIAFTADSGGGKSTLAAGLSNLGYPHICDDTLVLDPDTNQVLAFPDNKPLKLWGDAFDIVKVDQSEPITFMPGKFFATAKSKAESPLPLTDLYFLEFGDRLAIEPITGFEKAMRLPETFYRGFIQLALNDTEAHTRFITNMAKNVRFWRFTRPKDASQFDQVLKRLISSC